MKAGFFKDKFFLILMISLAGVSIVILPLLGSSFFSTHDETHMVDIYEMLRSLKLGGFPPRWAPDLTYGAGYPYFNFYYHLPFYLTSVIIFLGVSMTESFKMVMLIFVLLSFFGFYYFSRNHVKKEFALVSAILYIFSPYFAVDLYVRGGLGELAVFALLPWTGFFIYRLIQNTTLINLSLTALTIGFLAISHNVLHIFNFPFLMLYGVVLIFIQKKNYKKKLLMLFLAFLLGIFLSGYYLFPAFLERQFISNYEQINLADQFPFFKQLIIPYWGYGTSHWGPDDDLSFNIGTVNLIAVILAVFLLKSLKRSNKILVGISLLILAKDIFLMNSRSLFFWNILPIFHFVQFPWRLLIYTTFLTSLIFGISLEQLSEKYKKFNSLLFILFVIGAIVLLNFWHYHPSEYKQISDEKYLELYFANRTLEGNGVRPQLSPEYKNFAEDFLPPTIWQKQRPFGLPVRLIESEFPADISFVAKDLSYHINALTSKDNVLIINATYFPGWSATVDNNVAEVMPFGRKGFMALKIPSGKHEIDVQFKDTSIRKFSNMLSLITLAGLAGAIVFNRYSKYYG